MFAVSVSFSTIYKIVSCDLKCLRRWFTTSGMPGFPAKTGFANKLKNSHKAPLTGQQLTAIMLRYRVNHNTMKFQVILCGAALLLVSGWYMQLSLYDPQPSNDKVHVLLLSSWRSGSSFLGQVFSQHPSVFYLMEPGWHVWTQLRDLLRSLFQCDFSVMESYLPENQKELFMWSHSRALCSPPVCPLMPRNQLSNKTHCQQNCKPRDLKIVEQVCGFYSHVVYKEVHPRGVMRSKEKVAEYLASDNAIVLEQKPINEAEVQYQVMQEICRSHLRINKRAVLKPPPFLKGRYKLVRYEDVTRNPVKEIKSLYQFVGLEMTTQLATWIYQVTHGKGKGSIKEAFDITSRSATDISQAWRTMLPHNTVKRVQEVCEEAMSYLGYTMVNSEIEQKNLYVDLLVPQEQLTKKN
uniref:Sulfotransferase n=1 Tax=Maylandia zebra TaxID=106582 RepID=A0A3P9CD35_9CICH